jgi:hypothetical protein
VFGFRQKLRRIGFSDVTCGFQRIGFSPDNEPRATDSGYLEDEFRIDMLGHQALCYWIMTPSHVLGDEFCASIVF